jgi:hypothetical protein
VAQLTRLAGFRGEDKEGPPRIVVPSWAVSCLRGLVRHCREMPRDLILYVAREFNARIVKIAR